MFHSIPRSEMTQIPQMCFLLVRVCKPCCLPAEHCATWRESGGSSRGDRQQPAGAEVRCRVTWSPVSWTRVTTCEMWVHSVNTPRPLWSNGQRLLPAQPTQGARHHAGWVLNRNNAWDKNKTQLSDILMPPGRNSRLPCTHGSALHACLYISHTSVDLALLPVFLDHSEGSWGYGIFCSTSKPVPFNMLGERPPLARISQATSCCYLLLCRRSTGNRTGSKVLGAPVARCTNTVYLRCACMHTHTHFFTHSTSHLPPRPSSQVPSSLLWLQLRSAS